MTTIVYRPLFDTIIFLNTIVYVFLKRHVILIAILLPCDSNLLKRHVILIAFFQSQTKDSYSFGRSSTCDFKIDHKGVSRVHAVIWREMVNGNVVWHLADRSSTYGTAVNGKRVLDTVIKHGDSIVFAGAYGGNHAVSENIGEFVNSSRLGSKYWYRFMVHGYQCKGTV